MVSTGLTHCQFSQGGCESLMGIEKVAAGPGVQGKKEQAGSGRRCEKAHVLLGIKLWQVGLVVWTRCSRSLAYWSLSTFSPAHGDRYGRSSHWGRPRCQHWLCLKLSPRWQSVTVLPLPCESQDFLGGKHSGQSCNTYLSPFC